MDLLIGEPGGMQLHERGFAQVIVPGAAGSGTLSADAQAYGGCAYLLATGASLMAWQGAIQHVEEQAEQGHGGMLMQEHSKGQQGVVLVPATEQIALIDLLQGRSFRIQASRLLDLALAWSRYDDFRAEEEFARAVHWEWLASITEQGRVHWGERVNRCGPPIPTDEGE